MAVGAACSLPAQSGRTISGRDVATPDEFVGVDGAQFSTADVEREFWKVVQRPAVERAHRAGARRESRHPHRDRAAARGARIARRSAAGSRADGDSFRGHIEARASERQIAPVAERRSRPGLLRRRLRRVLGAGLLRSRAARRRSELGRSAVGRSQRVQRRRSASPPKSRATTSSCAARSSGSRSRSAMPTTSAKRCASRPRGWTQVAARSSTARAHRRSCPPRWRRFPISKHPSRAASCGSACSSVSRRRRCCRSFRRPQAAARTAGRARASARRKLLLRRRPDIRVAERDLAAATAQHRRRGRRSVPAHHVRRPLGLRCAQQQRSRQRGQRDLVVRPEHPAGPRSISVACASASISARLPTDGALAQVRADGAAGAGGDRREPDRVREGDREAAASAGKRDRFARSRDARTRALRKRRRGFPARCSTRSAARWRQKISSRRARRRRRRRCWRRTRRWAAGSGR